MNIPRNQTAVYWAPAGRDDYAATVFASPVELAVRWEDRMELYVDKEGREARSLAVVYPESKLVIEGYLAQTTLASLTEEQKANPVTVPGIQIIKSVQYSPSLKGDDGLYKVWL